MIEEIQEVATNAQVLPRLPGQVLQVIAWQGRLRTMQAQETDFQLIGRVLVLRRRRRYHITAGKTQAGRGREADALPLWLLVLGSFQIITVVTMDQIHQLEKAVAPCIAQNGLQLGYIRGCCPCCNVHVYRS